MIAFGRLSRSAIVAGMQAFFLNVAKAASIEARATCASARIALRMRPLTGKAIALVLGHSRVPCAVGLRHHASHADYEKFLLRLSQKMRAAL